MSVRSHVKSWSSRPKWPYAAVLAKIGRRRSRSRRIAAGRRSKCSRTKLAGLVEHYGFDAADPAGEYFRLHAERDIEHARAAREALAAAPPEQAEELAAVAERALEANWRLLDGVQRAA